MNNRRTEGFLYLVAFVACIPIANWMIGNVGTTCVPNGPCLVPVAPGLMAPSGVLMIGHSAVQRTPINDTCPSTRGMASNAPGISSRRPIARATSISGEMMTSIGKRVRSNRRDHSGRK